jgi:hypothetical protein
MKNGVLYVAMQFIWNKENQTIVCMTPSKHKLSWIIYDFHSSSLELIKMYLAMNTIQYIVSHAVLSPTSCHPLISSATRETTWLADLGVTKPQSNHKKPPIIQKVVDYNIQKYVI